MNGRQLVNEFVEANPNTPLTVMIGFDDAIVGLVTWHTKSPFVVYDRRRVIEILMEEGASYEEAEEFHYFNQVNLYTDGVWGFIDTPEPDAPVHEHVERPNKSESGAAPSQETIRRPAGPIDWKRHFQKTYAKTPAEGPVPGRVPMENLQHPKGVRG